MSTLNKSDWKKLINKNTDEAEFAEPAEIEDIEAAEDALGIEFPAELRAMLLEFNGLAANYGVPVVWSAEEIASQNLAFRNNEDFKELYKPFNHLLFFGHDGGGDQFAYGIGADGRVDQKEIFRWGHEEDTRDLYAKGLRNYFENLFEEFSEEEE